MPNHISKIKKLRPKAGDILIITLKGFPAAEQVWRIKDEFASMPFLKGVFCIFTTDKIKIKKGSPKGGKHQVFLNNLEYLEHMSKGKGETEE